MQALIRIAGNTLGESDNSMPALFWLSTFPFCQRRGTWEVTFMESLPDFEGDDPDQAEPVKAEAAGQARTKAESCDKAAPGCPKEVKREVETAGNEATDVQGTATQRITTDPEAAGPWVPERVKAALEASSSFDQFRKSRPFRYLHMFSGEEDQLAKSLKAEAARARLGLCRIIGS